MSTYFTGKCRHCGKKTINYTPLKVSYCSKECESNNKYSEKFVDNRYWKQTPLKHEET